MLLLSSFIAVLVFANTEAVCPLSDVQACMTTFSSQASSYSDFSNLDGLCRIYEALETCIAPYADDCAGNPMYDAGIQAMNSIRSVCPNIGGLGTTMSNEIPIDDHAPEAIAVNYSEPIYVQSEQSLCFQRIGQSGCLPPNPELTLIPPGSLTKGYYISSGYVSNYCRVARQYVQCATSPTILGDPNCASLIDMFNAQKAGVDVLCDAEGRTALEKIRPCANNHELQIMLYGYIQKISGIGEGRSHCGYNATETMCSDVTGVVGGMLDLVASSCGYDIRTTVQNLLVKLASNLVGMIPPEAGFNCPNIADSIRYL